MADLQRDFIFFNQTVHALHIFNSMERDRAPNNSLKRLCSEGADTTRLDKNCKLNSQEN